MSGPLQVAAHRPRPASRRAMLAALMLAALMLVSCQPPAEPTLPPATELSAATSAPQVVTAQPPTAVAVASPIAAAPSATPAEPTPAQVAKGNRQAVSVTILHTNDTMGEIDPCG